MQVIIPFKEKLSMKQEGKLRAKIRKEARQFLETGTSRHETYLQLKEKYHCPKQVADVIRNMPSKAALEKYGVYNYILLGLILLIPVVFLLRSDNLGTLLAFLFYAYIVASRTFEFYWVLTTLAGFGLIGMTGLLIFQPVGPGEWPDVAMLLILLIPMTILPVWVRKKLCPPPKAENEEYIDSKGITRMKTVYIFPDIEHN